MRRRTLAREPHTDLTCDSFTRETVAVLLQRNAALEEEVGEWERRYRTLWEAMRREALVRNNP